MKSVKFIILSLFLAAASHAQETSSQIANCLNVRDGSARLTCYDRIATTIVKSTSNIQSPENPYQTIDLADLKVDIKGLSGKRLSVFGSIQSVGDISFLKGDEMDMTPIIANIESLPRDDRKKLANGCQMLLCKGRFYGTVRRSPMGMVLGIERVEWN